MMTIKFELLLPYNVTQIHTTQYSFSKMHCHNAEHIHSTHVAKADKIQRSITSVYKMQQCKNFEHVCIHLETKDIHKHILKAIYVGMAPNNIRTIIQQQFIHLYWCQLVTMVLHNSWNKMTRHQRFMLLRSQQCTDVLKNVVTNILINIWESAYNVCYLLGPTLTLKKNSNIIIV